MTFKRVTNDESRLYFPKTRKFSPHRGFGALASRPRAPTSLTNGSSPAQLERPPSPQTTLPQQLTPPLRPKNPKCERSHRAFDRRDLQPTFGWWPARGWPDSARSNGQFRSVQHANDSRPDVVVRAGAIPVCLHFV